MKIAIFQFPRYNMKCWLPKKLREHKYQISWTREHMGEYIQCQWLTHSKKMNSPTDSPKGHSFIIFYIEITFESKKLFYHDSNEKTLKTSKLFPHLMSTHPMAKYFCKYTRSLFPSACYWSQLSQEENTTQFKVFNNHSWTNQQHYCLFQEHNNCM